MKQSILSTKRILAYLLLLLFSGSCAEDILTRLTTRTDVFAQNSADKIDILWVVDNSSSMLQHQNGLGESFQSFIDNLLETGVDYRIGIVSTDISDAGQLHSPRGVPVITPNHPSPKSIFLENVKVGIYGDLTERSFESVALTLGVGRSWVPSHPPTPPNNDFLRDEAALFIIMVSDEDDKSFGPVQYYRKLFESYKGAGNEGLINISAIVGDPEEGCSETSRGYAQPGTRYIELASQTGGIFTSICADFSESLKELSISASGLKSKYELASVPNIHANLRCPGSNSQAQANQNTLSNINPQAFCVTINNQPIFWGDSRQGFTYEQTSNSIIFGTNNIPPPQANITVEYQEYR